MIDFDSNKMRARYSAFTSSLVRFDGVFGILSVCIDRSLRSIQRTHPLGRSQLNILNVVYSLCVEDGYTTTALIASALSMDKRNLRRNLKELRELGYIDRIRMHGRGNSTRYTYTPKTANYIREFSRQMTINAKKLLNVQAA